MTQDTLSHLSADTKPLLEQSLAERITWVRRARWFVYPQAQVVLDRLEDLLSYPTQSRIPGMLLIGDSNNGKTRLIEEFARRHPAVENYGGENMVCPVLVVQTPPAGKEQDLYRQILVTLFKHVPSSTGAMRDDVVELLRAISVKVLIFDELNNMFALPGLRQQQSLNVIKYLANVLEVSVVGTGVRELERAVSIDPQLKNRLRPLHLPVWTASKISRRLMMSLERMLPFPEPSNLHSIQLTNYILAKTDGLIGEIIELIMAASILSLNAGASKITQEALADCGYQSPT
jgi:hypothetical protein